MGFSTTRKRSGGIKIFEWLDLSSTTSMSWIAAISKSCLYRCKKHGNSLHHWSHSNLLPCAYQSSSKHVDSLDVFSTSRYLRVHSLVKTCIICAYAICDA
ncbi:hypothetical protein K492DRAFT_7715 [Lichtheimia hyalospora FSU 10163]|nr:hypothetical protein K492DRAFT_7715 [Lichtheimia hyalospora FSU 10163]